MVKLKVNEEGQGAFYIMDGDEQLGEMVISISGNDLTVHHTEVSPKTEGKGYAKKLLDAMADFARENDLKVIPLCSYVYVQFKRHKEEYADIWNKE
jgi:predicted GNAT family acetyltransferase